VVTTSEDAAQSTHRPAASLLPEPVRQSALKRQSYLYKLVSDADRRRGHDTDTNSDASSSADYKPSASSGGPRQQQHERPHDFSDESFPPPPTAEELRSSQAASVSRRAVSQAGMSRLYKSPFLPP